ncbi:MAG: PmoA family protein [Verrucomicrobiota bacterium]
MSRFSLRILASAPIFFFLVSSSLVGAEVTCEESETEIVIHRNGQHILSYQKSDTVPEGVDPKYARSGFIHPIKTPSGKVLTDDYPLPHHSHQHGIFFAWRKGTFKGEEVNFWEHTKGTTVRHEKVLGIINEETTAGFRVQLAHVHGEETVLHETWTVLVDAETGFIDFTSEQTCATGSPLELSKFHYGGMALRGSRAWVDLEFEKAQKAASKNGEEPGIPEPCAIVTNEGKTRIDGNHSQPEWVSMTGPIDDEPVSITLIPHPSNYRHPQHVRLHPNMPYFCFIPTVEEAFQINPGETYVSRFLIVAEGGEHDPARLEQIRSAYAERSFP